MLLPGAEADRDPLADEVALQLGDVGHGDEDVAAHGGAGVDGLAAEVEQVQGAPGALPRAHHGQTVEHVAEEAVEPGGDHGAGLASPDGLDQPGTLRAVRERDARRHPGVDVDVDEVDAAIGRVASDGLLLRAEGQTALGLLLRGDAAVAQRPDSGCHG